MNNINFKGHKKMVKRCKWADYNDLMRKYHDDEWGMPVHDDQILYEFLVLEGAQAGLSWNTILQKRENFRKAFDNFNYVIIAKYGNAKIEELLNNPGIIRNKLKIQSSISNAKALLEVQGEFGSFDKYIWNFVDQNPIINNFEALEELPAKTKLSELMSKDLPNSTRVSSLRFAPRSLIYASR